MKYYLKAESSSILDIVSNITSKSDKIKLDFIPLKKNSLIIRLTNLEDIFDHEIETHRSDDPIYIDLLSLSKKLYSAVN